MRVLENDKNQHIDDFYAKFKEKVEQTHTFPCEYTFKFILPADPSSIARLHRIFENANGGFSSRDSKNGKYTSLTVKAHVSDADDVIIYYRQVAEIEGVMML